MVGVSRRSPNILMPSAPLLASPPLPPSPLPLHPWSRTPGTVLVLAPATLAVLALQNLRLLGEAVLSRHLTTPVSLSDASLRPRSLSLHLAGLRVSDRKGRSMLTSPMITVSLRLRPHTAIVLSAPSLHVFAVFDGADMRRSNWTAMSNLFSHSASSSPTSLSSTSTRSRRKLRQQQQSKQEQGKRLLERNEKRHHNIAISLNTAETLVSLQYGPSGRLLVPPIHLPGLRLHGDAVRDAAGIARTAQMIVARAAATAGPRAFPRSLRDGARRLARDAPGAAAAAIERGGARVRKLRRGVDAVDAGLAELPDSSSMRLWISRVSGFLKSLEDLVDGSDTSASSEASGIGNVDANGVASPPGTVIDDGLDDVTLEDYRELDEDIAPQKHVQ